MRVIFLNRFYWPDEPATAQLLGDLAEELANSGREVVVIASHPGGDESPYFQLHGGVTILRVGSTRWSRGGLLAKAVNFTTFFCGALWKLAFTAERGDRVVALTDPPLLGVGTWLVARLCGARIYHWVQDIYPEIAVVVTRQPWLRLLRPLRNLAWRRSDGCVTLGSDMAATLIAAGVPPDKITISPNWAPVGLTFQPPAAADPFRSAWHLEGKFVVAYSGNLGRVHDLGPVLDVAEALRDEPDIAFVFIGGGAQRASLESQAARRGLDHVHFFPAQPRDWLAALLVLGDLHLVTLLPGCERLVFPSKLYGVTAAGRPVVFIGPRGSEIGRLVNEYGFGRTFARDEAADIAAFIRALHADPAQLAELSEAAAEFGRGHSGPAQALASWQERLALE